MKNNKQAVKKMCPATFASTPKFIMFYLFPVDSVLLEGKTPSAADLEKWCLPENPDIARRTIHLFRPTPPKEIIADLKEMGLNGLACVGLDGSSLSLEEIQSPRYIDLIQKCRKAGILFIHSFPFADTYDNALTKQHPHIRQASYKGDHPSVGGFGSQKNSHQNIDYGSDEFIDFVKQSIDLLAERGVKVIDYGEPDHYPLPDNGYGESLVRAWKEATGRNAPHPTTLEYRRFMEDRNLRGLTEINRYVRKCGLSDHLTASPLFHCPTDICHNFGKYSRTSIAQLSTTYHVSFAPAVVNKMKTLLDRPISLSEADGLGCVESKSLRDWRERHAVYCGAGQGYPPERYEEFMRTTVILHQMDLFFWDYGNFRHESMYAQQSPRPFTDPTRNYTAFKRHVRRVMDAYRRLPAKYRSAEVMPEAMVYYAKASDYLHEINKEPCGLSGSASLYAIALKLQASDVPFMFAYDEYPQVLQGNGKDVPLLIVDGAHRLSRDFALAIGKWFSAGKAILCGGDLSPETKDLLRTLSRKITRNVECDAIDLPLSRTNNYFRTQTGIDTRKWRDLLRLKDAPVAFLRGNAQEGLLLYANAPVSRLYETDLAALALKTRELLGRPMDSIEGSINREVVRYRNGSAIYLAVANRDAYTETIRLSTKRKPVAVYPRRTGCKVTKETDGYSVALEFAAHETRIIELEEKKQPIKGSHAKRKST